MSELYELTGTVEHVVFHNESNQYTVLALETEEELVTVVGVFPYISRGEELKIIGEWTHHQSFGQQFKATTFERTKPKTASAIYKYLSGGAIKGIRAATAKKIVDLFGENTMDVIENEPQRLAQIKGITEKKAMEISDEIRKISGIRELMLYLSTYGVRPEEAVRVWKVYGGDAIYLINENPYCICDDLIGISFSIADSIAISMEKESSNTGRVEAGIVHVLRHNANNGHSCIPADKLAKTASIMLNVELEITQRAIINLCQNSVLICDCLEEIEYIFLPKYYQSEIYIAERVRMMMRYPPRSIVGIDEEIKNIENNSNLEYAQLQKLAIKAALDKGILILTGGPGTGKTTTLKAIIDILSKNGERVFLAAPTGRAAKRMSELTNVEAKTIHRMLQVEWDNQDNPVFLRNENNPLECDVVIVDELSMVDINVMEGLMSAVPLGCRLIMVGDTDQLPSVGAGNVLGDLIASKIIPTVELKEIFRQSRESLIVMNAHKIVNGELPDISRVDSDFFFMPSNNEEKLVSTISDLISTRLPNSYGYKPNEDIQILCVGRKGVVGTEYLNQILRDRINPKANNKVEADIMGTVFRVGDKVMHTKNNYDLPWYKDDGTYGEGVFNGDIGIVEYIDKHGGVLKVRIDDKEAAYEFEQAGKELEHAYAVTVHKSQGNEFPVVILPLYKGTSRLKYRNLLYTAITRAKEILIIIGEQSVINEMVNNNSKMLRYTGLLKMLERDE